MPQKIHSLEELKEAAGPQTFEWRGKKFTKCGAEFFIVLAGIARSSKYISYDPASDRFWVWNMIDDSEQNLKATNILKKQHTNIGEAIEKGAFFKDDN